MNITNSNQKMGFDKFSECNYNLHWSFSNFNRILMVAGIISRLPFNSKVLELGAGSSDLERMVKENFGREDINFYKIDGDNQYKSRNDIIVLDITSDECDKWCKNQGNFNVVVFMEVIEHLDKNSVPNLMEKIYEWIIPEGDLILTTPTPPYNGKYEDRVWPKDHNTEFTLNELYYIINKGFKINKQIGWSLEEREYNYILETDDVAMKIYSKLRGAFPESYIRSIIANISPVSMNRQVLMICKKRREKNGRLTST